MALLRIVIEISYYFVNVLDDMILPVVVVEYTMIKCGTLKGKIQNIWKSRVVFVNEASPVSTMEMLFSQVDSYFHDPSATSQTCVLEG